MDLLRKEMERKRKAVALAKKSSEVGRIEKTSVPNSLSSSSTYRRDSGDSSKKNRVTKKTYLKTADLRRFQEKQEEEERQQRERTRKRQRHKEVGIVGNVNESNSKNDTDDITALDVAASNGTSTKMDGIRSPAEDRLDGTLDDLEMTATTIESKIKSGDELAEEKRSESREPDMTNDEITKALRELGIPVWLFGEREDWQRMGRLREALESQKAELAGMSEMDDFRLGSGHGIRNTFLGGKKGRKDEDRDTNMKATSEATQSKSNANGDKSNTNKVLRDIIPKITDVKQDTDDPHKTIHRFFKFLLRHWEEDLASRPDSVKRTAAGRNETKTLKQCKDYIRPLFKLCKTRRLEETIMGRILSIVQFCEDGEFVKAHDAYIDVAIGRAAWPIGVTMVGIHARSGRARIESSNVAHVMNSELQRKYLTSVKRLMTYCQKKRKDVAPSKKVTNV